MTVIFGVITRVADPTTSGNMASPLGDVYFVAEERAKDTGYVERLEPVAYQRQLYLRVPVFHVGEVLIMDDDGREIPYPGRKPSKWDVSCEEFPDLDKALLRAREVSS